MNTYSSDKMYESYSNEVERMQKCIDELLQENKWLEMIIKEYIESQNEIVDNVAIMSFTYIGRE